MGERRFSNNEELKESVTTWLEYQDKEFFFKRISFLKDQWNKCIKLVWDYIGK